MLEKAASSRPGNAPALLASILVLIILFPLGYYVVRGVFAQEAKPSAPFLEPAETEHDKCMGFLEPREMRLHHWEYLRGVREEVVRYGKRDKDGLNSCGTCHKHRDRFCHQCHRAASVKPDCWGCHYYPCADGPAFTRETPP